MRLVPSQSSPVFSSVMPSTDIVTTAVLALESLAIPPPTNFTTEFVWLSTFEGLNRTSSWSVAPVRTSKVTSLTQPGTAASSLAPRASVRIPKPVDAPLERILEGVADGRMVKVLPVSITKPLRRSSPAVIVTGMVPQMCSWPVLKASNTP